MKLDAAYRPAPRPNGPWPERLGGHMPASSSKPKDRRASSQTRSTRLRRTSYSGEIAAAFAKYSGARSAMGAFAARSVLTERRLKFLPPGGHGEANAS